MPKLEELGKTIDEKINAFTSEVRKKQDEEKKLLMELSEMFKELGEKVYEAEKGDWKSTYYASCMGIESKKNELEELRRQKTVQKQMSICQSCGNSVSDEALFCPSCGNKIIRNKADRKCPNCGQKAKATDKFCGECGTTLPQIIEENEEEIKVCPACGSVCNSGGQFCENCGSAL